MVHLYLVEKCMSTHKISANEKKHQTNNPILRFALTQFFSATQKMLPSVDTILDAGCGEGYAAREVLKKDTDATLYGVDLSFNSLLQVPKVAPNVPACQASVRELPFASKSVDLVVSLEVLEHIPQPELAVREYIRVSRNYMLISVPNEPLFRLLRMLRGDNIRQCGNHPEHVNHWNVITFPKFLEAQGVKVLQVKSPPPFIWTIVLCSVS
jgi:2-polyprenyl-3-methyl-5-hydroxy-6-metoxy-1,4-benzoquinol methylase